MTDVNNEWIVHGPYQRRHISNDGETIVLQAGQGGDTPGGWFLVPTGEYRRLVEGCAWYDEIHARARAAVKEADPR